MSITDSSEEPDKVRDIIALFPGAQGVHIAADGGTGSRGDREAIIEHPLVKKPRGSRASLRDK